MAITLTTNQQVTLFNILHKAYAVYSDIQRNVIWVWYGGYTFNAYNLHGECVDTFTYTDLKTQDRNSQAMEIIIEHVNNS